MKLSPLLLTPVLIASTAGSLFAEKLVIKGGAMPGHVMTAKEVGTLATMPSREQLLASLMGTMNAPITKFVQTLNEVPSKFVRTVAALRDQKEQAPA